MEVVASHAGIWADLRVHYSDLWDVYASKGETESVQKEHARLKKILVEQEKQEPTLKVREDKALAKKCQTEVLIARHLIKGDQT